jgi:hypothetical protein
MREVNLSSSGAKPKTERLIVNLTNTSTGEVRKLAYDVRKLSGKAAIGAQINLAEFARDKNRDAIVGSLMFKEILAHTSPAEGAPELLDVLDEIEDDEELKALLSALLEAATGSTVTS